MMRAWGGVAIAALLSLLLVVGAAPLLWQRGVPSAFTDPQDFRAFYCAGAAIVRGANPYRVEPNQTCQRKVLATAGLRSGILPAPLPPYALVAFGVLARLPYGLATAGWLWLNLLAIAACIRMLAELSMIKSFIIGLSLMFSLGLISLAFGQLVPVVFAAVLFSALCAKNGNGVGAAFGATLTAFEPHIGLPVWIALAAFVPAARVPLAFAAVFLSTLTLLPGTALNLEYVGSVLPQHARSELLYLGSQYSLSTLLASSSVSFQTAIYAGSLSYVCMLSFGLALGGALRRRFDNAAFVVTAPIASVVLGGEFIHLQQLAFALPLGFMLAGRLPRFTIGRYATLAAACALSIPWPIVGSFVSVPVPERRASVPVTSRAPHITANESIEIPYTAAVEAYMPRSQTHSIAARVEWKLPSWVSLIVILLSATKVALDYGVTLASRRDTMAA